MFTYRVMQRLLKPLCCAALLVGAYSAQASDIRQFSLKTTENLGRELYEQTQRAATLSEPQRRAKRAAMAALPQLEKQGYRFIVLNDPERKGRPTRAECGRHLREWIRFAARDTPRRILLDVHGQHPTHGDVRISYATAQSAVRGRYLRWHDLVHREGQDY